MPLKLVRVAGIWQVRGTQIIPGKKNGVRIRQSSRTPDKAEAERFLEAVRKGLIDEAELGSAAVYTVAEAIEYYLEKGGESKFLLPILERFGKTRVAQLSDQDVSKYATERYGHMKPSSVKRVYYTPFNAIIRKSSDKGLCPSRRFEPPKIKREPARYASETYWDMFQPAANEDLIDVCLMMMTTSARVSEALNLVPADLDLQLGTGLLRKTKNGKARQVLLGEVMIERLRRAIERNGLGAYDRLFPYSHRKSVNQALQRAAKRAGIEYLSSHEIGRHTFAARFLAHGYSLKALQVAGDWASISIVSETYGHLEKSQVEDAVREVGRRIGITVSGASFSNRGDKPLTNAKAAALLGPPQVIEKDGGH